MSTNQAAINIGAEATQPRRRRLRSRSSIEYQGAEHRLAELRATRPRLTLDEITQRLREEGFQVSRSAVNRWCDAAEEPNRRLRELLARAVETCSIVAESGSPLLSIEKANVTVVSSQLLEHIQEKRTVDQETLALAKTVSRLTGAACQLQRVEIARERAVAVAMSRMKELVKAELAKRPDLVREITLLIEAAGAEAAHPATPKDVPAQQPPSMSTRWEGIDQVAEKPQPGGTSDEEAGGGTGGGDDSATSVQAAAPGWEVISPDSPDSSSPADACRIPTEASSAAYNREGAPRRKRSPVKFKGGGSPAETNLQRYMRKVEVERDAAPELGNWYSEF